MSNKGMPITRSLTILDKILALIILALGLVMMYLAIQEGRIDLGVISLVFLAIGFVKVRGILPDMFQTMRRGGSIEPPIYKNALLPVSRLEAVESMIKMGSDVISPGGRLAIINVIELPPQLPSGAAIKKDSARALLHVATEYADKNGIESSAEIVSARATNEAILNRAKEYKCDLIIMGSSQRTATEKMIFGNVADVILQRAPCDVMVLSYTNTQHPVKYVKILVPTAGYRHSKRALDIAVDIVKKEGGAITSLYVGQETDAAKGNQILEEARLRAETSGVKSDVKFMTGNVADTIVNMAKDGDYALIIIGATEHPKYYTALLGNIADNVVKRAPCDVLVVRTKK